MHTALRPPRRRSASPQRHPPLTRRDRDGRLLVECMVAAVLLNATALVVASAALGLIGAAQHVTNSAESWAIALQQLESAAAINCSSSPSAGAIAVGIRRVTWTDQPIGADSAARDRTVTISQPVSAWSTFGRLASANLTLRDARACR